MRTVDDVIQNLRSPPLTELKAPHYQPLSYGRKNHLFLAVEQMRRHTADAGWQLTIGLQHAGYTLCGTGFREFETNVAGILKRHDPKILILQDKREWDGRTAGNRGRSNFRFTNVGRLKERNDVFKLTVLKDAHQEPDYHRDSADEMGAHAWITYYHPDIVKHVAPYVRKPHLVRTYHSVNLEDVPDYTPYDRGDTLISGAVSKAYPLREYLIKSLSKLQQVEYKRHPGYAANGCVTPQYLKLLSRYRVAICTSSKYGYTLRKIIEATACGCMVLTDLPIDDPLPYIDGNLTRTNTRSLRQIQEIIRGMVSHYDPSKQEYFSNIAKQHYDYRVSGANLAADIECLRRSYNRANQEISPNPVRTT